MVAEKLARTDGIPQILSMPRSKALPIGCHMIDVHATDDAAAAAPEAITRGRPRRFIQQA